MSLFHKNKPSENETPKPQTALEENSVTSETSFNKTTEERAREWWQTRYGENMPDEIVRWLKQLTRTEARRQTIAASLLNPQQLARMEDARRLAETKLRDIETSLQRLYEQRDLIHRFNEKKHELTEHRNRLYEVNKLIATQANEEQELLRFETFENIHGPFLRMTMMEELSRNNKQAQSQKIRQMEDVQRTVTEQQKKLQLLTGNSEDAAKQMLVVRDQTIEASRIEGARNILELDKLASDQLTESINQKKLALSNETTELEAQISILTESITQQCAQRQKMEPHQHLIEHGEMVLTLLNRLNEMRTELDQLSRQQDNELRQQQDENDMLSRVFTEYQDIEADIKTLMAELHMHRHQNLGRSSYSLQERAMQLKTRRQMLLAAQSLWNRIHSGYQLIEEKTQTINRIRLSLDNLKLNISNLEAQLVPMRKLCQEKEYTLTLSKSQNVIQLRGDLREGVNCTVCGATHHPYHSDTMLEQTKLIGELRTDFELLQAEVLTKEEQLRQMLLQQASETAQRETEEATLSQLRQRQMEDVREWAVFAPLDRTFDECSSSTNAEARSGLLRQLIENTAYDADDAQKELDEFNYHQTRINEISESLNQKEQRRNDLTVRLNEVNTGCQVLVRQTEQTRKLRTQMQDQFTALYEQLNKHITINEWYKQWQQSHESIQLRIEQMMELWNQVEQNISQQNHQQETLRTALEEKNRQIAFLEAIATAVNDEANRRQALLEEGKKVYEDMIGEKEIKLYFDQYYQKLQQTIEDVDYQRNEMEKSQTQLAELQGHQQELTAQGKTYDAATIEAKSQLDVWIRQFNANHPPVQYAELQQAFAINKDWNSIRERIRSTRIEAMLEQARVDNLRSVIVALQAEGVQPGATDEADALQSLVIRQQQLEQQRQQILMQLAEQHVTLMNHEACQARLKTEEEELYAMTDGGTKS